jgi:alpha-1,6-mannosyltransferase
LYCSTSLSVEKLRIVDVTMFYTGESGGVRTYLNAKANWLARWTSIEHMVVAPIRNDEKNDAAVVRVPGIPVPRANGYRMPLSCRMSARRIQSLQPDLIEVGDPYQSAWAALRVKHSIDVPVVAFCHSDLAQVVAHRFGPLAHRIAAKYLADLYRRFDLVLAPSKVMARRLREMGIERVRWQPLGVDTRIFSPQRRDPRLRARLGLAEQTRLLVYAGRFAREKKLHLLLEAVRRLGDPYHLIMIGSGAALPRSERVTYLPFQHDTRDLAKLIASCDLLVHPGDQETFGLIVLEAMACGIPVVGVAAGGIGELVESDTGILVPPGSAAALAEGISHMYEKDRVPLGDNARRKTLERYDWNAVIPQLVAHYTNLFTARRRAELGMKHLYAPD